MECLPDKCNLPVEVRLQRETESFYPLEILHVHLHSFVVEMNL